MVLSWDEIYGLGALVMYFALSGFAWLLPLKAYLKNWDDTLKLCIPISLSLQILFAYVFYTFNAVRFYPFAYLVSSLAINIGVGLWLRKSPILKARRVPITYLTILASIFMVAVFIYTRFYDAFSTAAPGAIDTFNHMRFMRDLQEVGHLSFQTYAPGFHLLVYPINLIIGDGIIYRFAGPVIGLLLGLSLYFLFRQNIRTLSARLLMLALLCFPVFAPLGLQTMSFFPTALTFILLPAILSPLIHDYKQIGRAVYGLMFILILSLSVTVPYLFVQIIPPFIILFPFLFFFRSKISASIFKKIAMTNVLLIVGFFVAFGLTYTQGKLYTPTVSFPTIAIASVNPSPTTSNNLTDNQTTQFEFYTDFIVPLKNTVTQWLNQYPFYTNFIGPFLTSGLDIIHVKSIRPLNSILSIGAYLWGILSVGILMWAFRRKYVHIVLTSYLCIFFTVVTQTGILEMTTYRGRTGWYLLLFTLLTMVFVFDKFKVAHRPVALGVPALLAVVGLFFPPTFYRPFQPHIFDVAHQLVQDTPRGNKLVFYANEPVLSILGENITVIPATPQTIGQPCPSKTTCSLFIEKTYQSIDPVLSQRVDTFESNLATLNAQSKNDQITFETNKNDIESSIAFQNYLPIIKDTYLTVYQK